MAIATTGTAMTSDLTSHRARWEPDEDGGGGAWVSTRCPGQRLTYAQAAAAMVLAELEVRGQHASARARQLRDELSLPPA